MKNRRKAISNSSSDTSSTTTQLLNIALLACLAFSFSCSQPSLAQKDTPSVKASADVDFGPYMADMQRRVKRCWFPPRGEESKRVVLSWKIDSDGKVTGVKVEKSSGVKIADAAAVRAVNEAAPMRPLPVGAPPSVDIQFTFDYNVFNNSQDKFRQDIAEAERTNDYPKLAQALYDLGKQYEEKEKVDDAITVYKRALNLLSEKVTNRDLQADVDTALGDIYYNCNEYDEAYPLYAEALEDVLSSTKYNQKRIAEAKRDLAYTILYRDDEHTAESQKLFEEALPLAEGIWRREGPNSENFNDNQELYVDIKYGIGHCFWKNGKYSEALAVYKWVVPETKKLDGTQSARILRRTKDIADCFYELGQYKEALPVYNEVIDMSHRINDGDEDEIAEAKTKLEFIKENLGLPTEADAARDAATRKSINKAYSWLPYAFGGALLSLLIIYLVGAKQNTTIDIAGRNKQSKDS